MPRRRTLRFSMTLCIIRGPPSDTISPCRENGPALQPLSRIRARSSPRCQQAQCSLHRHQGSSPHYSCRGLLLFSWRWEADKLSGFLEPEDLHALSTW